MRRLYFFDILRILAAAAIVFFHIAMTNNWDLPFGYRDVIYGLFFVSLGPVAVTLLIFVSGAMIEYTHSNIQTIKEYADFIFGRIKRIYPAFWICLFIGLFYIPHILDQRFSDILVQFTGFSAFTGMWGGNIDGVSWFIGLIICLYLLYPFMSRGLKSRYWIYSMFLFTFITFWLRYIFVSLPWVFSRYGFIERWFPLCNLFAFALGILVIQRGWYPKIDIRLPVISKFVIYLSGLSFYIFLVHCIFINIAVENLFVYVCIVLIVSMMVMKIDSLIQSKHTIL